MTAHEREETLVRRYKIIPDIQERLMAATRHRGDVLELPEPSRHDGLLVPGCQSRVWLQVDAPRSLLVISMAADSPLVRGLVALVCDVFAGLPPHEAADTRTTIIAALGFERQITPTRLQGLASVEAHIRSLAAVLAQ